MLQQLVIHVVILVGPTLPSKRLLHELGEYNPRFYNLVVNDDISQYYDQRITNAIVDVGRFWIGLPPRY